MMMLIVVTVIVRYLIDDCCIYDVDDAAVSVHSSYGIFALRECLNLEVRLTRQSRYLASSLPQ